jgi:aspartate/methionine/tyrosine aminotransferase
MLQLPLFTGIFENASVDKAPLLRVAEVSLDMHELLTGMAEEASKVISCIVEMTNIAFATPLPATPKDAMKEAPVTAQAASVGAEQSQAAMVACPDVVASKKHNRDDDDEDTIVTLSAEKCANIIDCLIGELDDTVLSPHPCCKRVKVFKDSELPLAIF